MGTVREKKAKPDDTLERARKTLSKKAASRPKAESMDPAYFMGYVCALLGTQSPQVALSRLGQRIALQRRVGQ